MFTICQSVDFLTRNFSLILDTIDREHFTFQNPLSVSDYIRLDVIGYTGFTGFSGRRQDKCTRCFNDRIDSNGFVYNLYPASGYIDDSAYCFSLECGGVLLVSSWPLTSHLAAVASSSYLFVQTPDITYFTSLCNCHVRYNGCYNVFIWLNVFQFDARCRSPLGRSQVMCPLFRTSRDISNLQRTGLMS